MTLLQIYEIEREVAENPPLPGLTVRRILASVRWWGLCITARRGLPDSDSLV